MENKAISWETPITNSYRVFFCNQTLAVDHTLRVTMQARDSEGEDVFFLFTWRHWLNYRISSESCYWGPSEGFAQLPYPCFTYEVNPSEWLDRQKNLFEFPHQARHFVLVADNFAMEVLSVHPPSIDAVPEFEARRAEVEKHS